MYSDHAIDVLIQTSQIPVKELCHPVLYRMATAGSDLDKEYVDTLLHYVRCMKDAAQVSKAMHIHKNTLFYRISKVLDAAGLDLSRGEDVLMILITDRIFRTPSFIDPLTSVNV